MASRIGKVFGTTIGGIDGRIISGLDGVLSIRDAYTTVAAGQSQSTLDKILDTVAAIGSVAEAIDEFGQLTEKTRESINEAQRIISSLGSSSRKIEDVFELVQQIPNSLVRKIAKAAEAGSETAVTQLRLLNDGLNSLERSLDKLYPLNTKLDAVVLIGDAAALAGFVKDVIEEFETKEYDFLDAVLDALIGDFDSKTGDGTADPNAPASIDLPEPDENQDVANEFAVAMDAFAARFQTRENNVAMLEEHLDTMFQTIADLVPDETTSVQEYFETEIVARLNTISGSLSDLNGSLDSIDVMSDIIDPLDDVASVLKTVQEAVQPVLDFFGPVTSLVDKAVGALEDVLGLTALEAKIKQAIQNGVSSLFDPVKAEIQEAIDSVTDAVIGVLGELLDGFLELREQALELALNPAGEIGDVLGVTDDVLDSKAIAAGRDGDDLLSLKLDPRFDDGHGALGLGGSGNDTIRGTELKDVLNGGADDDAVFGLGGDDLVFGGSGLNTVDGGAGNDAVFGGADRDVLNGGSGNDAVYGDAGNDDLSGGAGNDVLDGEAGDDRLNAGAGNDSLLGGEGNDLLIADQGDNILDGQEGLDRIRTLGAADATHLILDATASLTGGAGRDTVSIGDAFAEGQSIDPGTAYDGGGNEDRFIAGSLDAIAAAPRITGIETLEIRSAGGEAKTLVTDAESLRGFRTLELTGEGDVTIDVRSGDFRMDGMFDDQPFLIDLDGLGTTTNAQDGANAGIGGKPVSQLANLTVKLGDPSGGVATGQVGATRGITFEGGAGSDVIVGGSGSDVIRGGLGADILDGGPSDGGDRFDLDSAVGDVFLGTPEELDGDTIRNLSNRVDRVRVTGSQDYALQATSGAGASVVAIYASQTALDAGEPALASFTLAGEYPKLITRTGSFDQDGTAVPYVEILNNNVPPTAVGENIVTQYQGEGDDPVAVDPLANDYDVDTPAGDGVERREIAVTESLSALFRVIEKDGIPLTPEDPDYDDLARAAFQDGLTPVAIGTEITTELGNKLIFTAEGIVYEAPVPTMTLRGLTADEGPASIFASEIGKLDLSEGLAFFGRDRITYKVFDLEGEVSNRASLDILIRPDNVTYADGTTGAPVIVIDTTADPAIVTGGPAEATLVDLAPGTTIGTDRGNFTTDTTASFAIGNDRFTITEGGSYHGLGGEDVMIAQTDEAVQLFGGRGADWLEGGDGNDFLSAGGYDDTYIIADTRQAPDSPEPMNILLGGAGDNVFASSFGNATGDIPRIYLQARDTVYVLDGGAEIITGALTFAVDSGGFIQNPGSYGAMSTAEALQDDLIQGFDNDDQILIGMSREDLTHMRDAPLFNPDTEVPDYTGILSTDLDMDQYLGMSSPELLTADGPFGDLAWDPIFSDNIFGGAIQFPRASFNGFPAIVTHAVEAQPFDPNGGQAPYTLLTVSLKAYRFDHDLAPETSINSALVEDPGFLDPLNLYPELDKRLDVPDLIDGAHVTFTMELDGFYRDRFKIDMVEYLTNGAAPFVSATERSPEYGAGTYRYEYFSDAIVRDIEGTEPRNILLDPPASGKDGNVGLSIKYVSAAPETTDDTAKVRRGDAITLDLVANDSDADGDTVQVFDLVFQDDAQRARLTDGDTVNGELIEQTDPRTGLGTGVVTYVAPEEFIGLESFGYIATDGEYQADPTDVSINVTGLPPVLGDDRIILSEDGFEQILFSDLLANDFEPDAGEAPDASTIRILGLLGDYGEGTYHPDLPVTIPGFTPPPPVVEDPVDGSDVLAGGSGDDVLVGNIGGSDGDSDDGGPVSTGPAAAELTEAARAALLADTIDPDGTGGTSVSFQYTLGDVGEGGRSDAATVEVFMAADFSLADSGVVTVREDSSIAIDLLSGRTGGFGEARITSVSAPIIEGTGFVIGSGGTAIVLDGTPAGTVETWGNGIIFTPSPDLSGVTAEIRVQVQDDLQRQLLANEPIVVKVAIAPVDDAPVFEQTTQGAAADLVETDEDTPATGTVRLFDIDAAAPAAPASPDPIRTEAGGMFELTATATPGTYAFSYSPAADYSGRDEVRLDLAGTGETVSLATEVAPVNDEPRFDGATPALLAFEVGSARLIDLLANLEDIDSDVDPASLQIETPPDPAILALDVDANGFATVAGAGSGQTTLSFSVADDQGARSQIRTLAFDINAAPEATDDRVELRDLTQPILIDAIANDADGDGTIAYATGMDGLPVAIDPAQSVDPDAVPSMLGTVTWSEADGAFLYTPPNDPAAFGKTDVFHYQVTDDDGASSRGTVLIDLIAPNQQALRIATADRLLQAETGPEEFLLGAGPNVLDGTATTFDGDTIFGFGPDDALVIDGVAPAEVSLGVTRLRTPVQTGPDLDALDTAPGVFASATVEDLSAAFIGDTHVTIQTPAGTGSVTLGGAYLGAFDVADNGSGGVVLTYAPTADSAGDLAGTGADDDLRSLSPGGTVTGGGGDDVLRQDTGDGALDGGAGRDALSSGTGATALTGGQDGDLFLIRAGAAPVQITDFNPYDGDRLAIADQTFLNDDQTVDLERVRIETDGSLYRVIGNPNPRDDDGVLGTDLADVVLATYTLPAPLVATDDMVTGHEDTVLTGDLAANDTGLPGYARTYALETGPAQGTAVVAADGTLTYMPTADFNGTDSLTYRVTVDTPAGEVSRTATVDLSVAPVNDAPVAVDDAGFATDADVAITIAASDLLANDSDVEAADLVLASVSDGQGGSAEIVGDTVVFTPDADYSGPASFRYVASDGALGSNEATVTIEVIEDDPYADFVRGTDGDDLMVGDLGVENRLFGAGGDDRIFGLGQADHLAGGEGNDIAVGGWGEDILDGNEGHDNLFGGWHDDVLNGNEGNDRLLGGAGADILDGGTGDDRFWGGLGADTFHYMTGDGDDLIWDFFTGHWFLPDAPTDTLSLDVQGIAGMADVLAVASQDGSSTVLDFGDGNRIVLAYTQVDSLTEDHFTFG